MRRVLGGSPRCARGGRPRRGLFASPGKPPDLDRRRHSPGAHRGRADLTWWAAGDPRVGRALSADVRQRRRDGGGERPCATRAGRRRPRPRFMIGSRSSPMMAVFGASAKASINSEIERTFKADYLVSNAIGNDFPRASATTSPRSPGSGPSRESRWGMQKLDGGISGWLPSTRRPSARSRSSTWRAGRWPASPTRASSPTRVCQGPQACRR